MTCKLTYMSASMLALKYSLEVLFQSFWSSMLYTNLLKPVTDCVIKGLVPDQWPTPQRMSPSADGANFRIAHHEVQ